MKKSSFTALVLGTVSGVLFALGMCMALLPEWNLMQQGIITGSIGIVLGLVTIMVWRKMENKPKIRLSKRTIMLVLVGIIGVLAFGAGMCLCMVFDEMVYGIILGLVGIADLLLLVSLIKGVE